MTGDRSWKDRLPPDRAWRSRRGATPRTRASEQDRAAGGRSGRTVSTSDGGHATASVALRVYKRTRRVRAYLRWSESGTTKERYIGEVDHPTRARNLKSAWELAHTSGFTELVPEDSWASDAATRAVMRGNKSRDTSPERRLRSALHRLGLRFRVGIRPLPELRRTGDIVFTKARVAVFVDGCYWHGCPQHHRAAKTNVQFWNDKIWKNKDRDAETNRILEEHGWRVVRVWEHEVDGAAAHEIADLVVRCRHRESVTSA